MHNLTPEFILQKLAHHETQGQFAAVVLFVDTSGFTPLTTALLQHGTEGAEIIARVLANLFTPLVELVYRHGGFIAGFAGDAFKAIFPGQAAATYQRALTAAWQIHQHLAARPVQPTRFGDFPFALKVIVADGNVDWCIWQSEDTAAALAQQAATLFAGAALTQALAADPFTKAGEVLLTPPVAAQAQQEGVVLEPVGSYFRLCAWPTLSDPPRPAPAAALTRWATHFFPTELLTRQLQGEFRRVVTVFINIQQLPSGAAAPPFATTLFRLLAQYGGYLCRIGQIGDRDPGGTLLLFWGAPTTYEQDVIRALSFVLALQTAAPTHLRAGITTHLAYAGFVGAPQREEYTCYGSHVNLAARLMVMAGWDEIWLDDETTHLAGATFLCAQHGAFHFKGFTEERVVYRLLGQRENASQPFYQGTLIGRQAELAQLAAALAPLAEGKFAGILTISGEAGIGKSRLVHELRVASSEWQVAGDEWRVASGERQATLPATRYPPPATQWFLCQADEILRQPLNPFRYWLRGYFNQSTSADEAANKAAFTAKLDDLLTYLNPLTANSPPITRHTQLATELARTRSFLGALIDLHWPDSLYAQVEPQLRFENTLAALKTLILAESLRQPVILHLEDAHWLDADSQTLLARLTHNVADYPLSVIVTRRPEEETGRQGDTRQGDTRQGDTRQGEEDPDRLALAGPQMVLRLTTLSRDEIRALAAAQLQGDLAPALVTLIEERAEGNPFFAEQLLRYLQEQAWLVQGAAGWQLRADQAATTLLPSGARALLVARLDQLPQPVKEVVQTAAVLGREFDTNVLAQMLADDQMLAAKLAVADRAAIWHAMTQARYLFRHALLREAAYDMQLRARLRTLHHRAGTALEQVYAADLTPYLGELAYHYDQAEVTEVAARWYGLAGKHARTQYANITAIQYLDRALALTPAVAFETRYDLLLEHEAVLDLLGKRETQLRDIETLEQWVVERQDSPKQAEVALRQAKYALATGQYATAATYTELSARWAALTQDRLAEARAYHRWGRAFWQAGEYKPAKAKLELALSLARAHQNAGDEEAQCLFDLGVTAYYEKAFNDAIAYIQDARQLYAARQDLQGESTCLSLWAVILGQTGSNHQAMKLFEQALQLCRSVGWRYGEARFLAQSGNNALNLGHLELAQQRHEQAITIFQEIGDREGAATSQDTLGLVHAFQGNPQAAKACYEKALAIHHELHDERGLGYVLTHLGYTLVQLQEWAPAEEVLAQALTIRQQDEKNGLLMDTLAGCALVMLAYGRKEQALAYVHKILGWIERHGLTGVEFPGQVYLVCWQVLQTLAAGQRVAELQANAVLATGYRYLSERAERVEDVQFRHTLIQNIPFHREIVRLWQRQRPE